MKIPARVRYGLRFMIELAGHYEQGPVFLKNIARSQDISEKYLSQIVVSLKAARLIGGFRGAHGGYVLARVPAEISVYNIFTALEGDLTLMDSVQNPTLRSKAQHCVSQEVWHKLGQTMTDTLVSITLADLLERRQKKLGEVGMYHI